MGGIYHDFVFGEQEICRRENQKDVELEKQLLELRKEVERILELLRRLDKR